MQGILVGLGRFGEVWYDFLKDCSELKLAVVDSDEEKKTKVKSDVNFYTSLEEAVKGEEPEFIINVTPPGTHNKINRTAFEYEVPVLSEKPICADYKEAKRVVNEAEKKKVPFMIAENYRYFPIIRKAKKFISKGRIGKLKTIEIEFRRNFKADKDYFNNLDDPLLLDVSIHHFDLIRYLTDKEGDSIFARSFSPRGSWFSGNSNLYAFLELTDEVLVNYSGSLVSKEAETPLMGNWKIEGTKGMIILRDNKLCLIKNGEVRELEDFEAELCLEECFDEFIFSLTEEREFETSAGDYLKTQKLIYFAKKSSREGKLLSITEKD